MYSLFSDYAIEHTSDAYCDAVSSDGAESVMKKWATPVVVSQQNWLLIMDGTTGVIAITVVTTATSAVYLPRYVTCLDSWCVYWTWQFSTSWS